MKATQNFEEREKVWRKRYEKTEMKKCFDKRLKEERS